MNLKLALTYAETTYCTLGFFGGVDIVKKTTRPLSLTWENVSSRR